MLHRTPQTGPGFSGLSLLGIHLSTLLGNDMKTTPEKQEIALLVRDAIAVLGIDFPSPEDDRFRVSVLLRTTEEIQKLEPGQMTRLHEAACKADSKHAGVNEFRTAIRRKLGQRYDLAAARKRAKESTQTTP